MAGFLPDRPHVSAPHGLTWALRDGVATVTFDRPEKKNALTFAIYGELLKLFEALRHDEAIKAVVLSGAGGHFCSGGDVKEIIGPLVEAIDAGEISRVAAFTRLTGDLVKAMRACPQPIIAAVDGICTGAGAALAMASDIRIGTARARIAFLFVRVGLCGADMGACSVLPRIIGAGRAAELLYTGRFMQGDERSGGAFSIRCISRMIWQRRPTTSRHHWPRGRPSPIA